MKNLKWFAPSLLALCDMYKHPPVEGEARKDFREGFREGYRRAMDHMMHEGAEHRDEPHF
jgi:hypothetical protein